MCSYCNQKAIIEKYWKDRKTSAICSENVKIIPDKLMQLEINEYFLTVETKSEKVTFEINFCPFCGNDLRSNRDE